MSHTSDYRRSEYSQRAQAIAEASQPLLIGFLRAELEKAYLEGYSDGLKTHAEHLQRTLDALALTKAVMLKAGEPGAAPLPGDSEVPR